MNLNEKWFYMKNRETRGPLPLSAIRELIQRGELRAMDAVFHDILGQWTPAGKVAALQEFFGAAPTAVPPASRPAPATSKPISTGFNNAENAFDIPGPPPPVGAVSSAIPTGTNAGKSATLPLNSSLTPQINIILPPTTGIPTLGGVGGTATSVGQEKTTLPDDSQSDLFDVRQEENSESGLAGITNQVTETNALQERKSFLDFLPNLFRSAFPLQFGDQIVLLFYKIGNWALALACLLLIGQIVIETVALKSISFSRGGALCCLLSLYAAFYYVNVKLRNQLIRLNRLNEGYISSHVVPDALSVLFFIIGACGLVFFFSWGMAKIIPPAIAFVLGFEVFIGFAFAAVIAANPVGMKILINPNQNLSEETLGVLQYLMKLGIRLCCGGYGIASLSCCALIAFSQANLFHQDAPLVIAAVIYPFTKFSLLLLLVAVVPLASYLFFLAIGCGLDVAQKILQTGRRG